MQWRLAVDARLVEEFAAATGDRSAIHLDPEFARLTRFRRPIVHGMLPVLAVLRGAAARWAGEGLWLREVRSKFLNPAQVGDTLLLSLHEEPSTDGSARYRFEVTQLEAKSVVSQGVAVFASGAPHGAPSESATLVFGPIGERVLNAESITLGLSESLPFRAAPAGVRELLECLDAYARVPSGECGWRTFDPNLLSVLVVSPLIGMRLPGRLATFTELDLTFDRPIPADLELSLTGTVEKIMPGGNRLRLSVLIEGKGASYGRGSATTIVNTAAPTGIGCEEIQARYLSTGIAERVALVTGASRGIGAAIAKLLSMHGAKVAVHYFQGAQDAAAIVEEIRRHGGVAIPVGADLRLEGDVETMFGTVRAGLGEVDILVNNAVGDFSPKPFDDLVSRDYLEELEVSVFGMHACCRRAVAHMRAQRWGKIINISTIATEAPVTGQNKYITAKSAAIGYTRSLATELSGHNIQVNLVLPRMTDTTLVASVPQALVSRIASESPTGKLLQPIDVAGAVAFLASNWAGAISGQRIVLSQGEVPFL